MPAKGSTCKPEVTPEVRAELQKVLSLNLPVTKDKIIVLLVTGIKFTQESGKFSGASKKAVVLEVLRTIIEKQTDKEDLIAALDLVGSDFIDVAVGFGQDVKTFISERCL